MCPPPNDQLKDLYKTTLCYATYDYSSDRTDREDFVSVIFQGWLPMNPKSHFKLKMPRAVESLMNVFKFTFPKKTLLSMIKTFLRVRIRFEGNDGKPYKYATVKMPSPEVRFPKEAMTWRDIFANLWYSFWIAFWLQLWYALNDITTMFFLSLDSLEPGIL